MSRDKSGHNFNFYKKGSDFIFTFTEHLCRHLIDALSVNMAYCVSFESCVALNNVCAHKCLMMELLRGQWRPNC